jgi:8-oxo-dGTP pyrophosphatase MutT (NUDIX family)
LVVHQGSVALVAIDRCGQDSKQVLLVRQYRHAAGRELWEIPAGRIDTAETAPAAALRELAEEAGLAAKRLEPLMSFYASPGYCTERLYVFVASDLSPVSGESGPGRTDHNRLV